MWKGSIVSIYIAPESKAPMESCEEARAVPGKGLVSDRYSAMRGTYSSIPGSGRQLTLIESEAIEAAAVKLASKFEAGDSRRNLVTRNVPLNHLVGQDFRVGEVIVRGIRLCEPCAYLEGLTQAGVQNALLHRGGLRAEILSEGNIHVGDLVAPLDSVVERNKQLIRRYYEEMWNPWNFSAADDILTDAIVFRGSLGVETKGREAFRKYMKLVRATFPDFHNTIQELVAEGDTVVARLTYHGTHRGEMFGIAGSQKKITYAGTAIFKIADGRVAEGWVLGDRLSLLEQISGPLRPPFHQEK